MLTLSKLRVLSPPSGPHNQRNMWIRRLKVKRKLGKRKGRQFCKEFAKNYSAKNFVREDEDDEIILLSWL